LVLLSHRKKLKAELDRFCEEHGLKQQTVVSEPIASWLEDAGDLALIEPRRGGPWVEWSGVRESL